MYRGTSWRSGLKTDFMGAKLRHWYRLLGRWVLVGLTGSCIQPAWAANDAGAAEASQPRARPTRVEQADNQQLLEIMEKSGPDPRGDSQLMKDALQAIDVGMTTNGQQGQKEFARQLQLIMNNSMYVALALGNKNPAGRIRGANAALQLKSRQLDVSANAVATLRTRSDADSLALLDTLYKLAAMRSKLSFEEVEGPAQAMRVKRLKDLEREQDRLRLKLVRMSEQSNDSKENVTLERVQEQMGERDVLIEWARVNPFNMEVLIDRGKGSGPMWNGPRYVAFVIVRDKPPEVVDLGPADLVEEAVKKLQVQLRTPLKAFDRTDANTLFNLVIKPLLGPISSLRKNIDQIMIAPDGALNFIPFAALVDDQGRYLGERYTLTYLTSGRDLLRLKTGGQPAKGREQIVVIAAPDYSAADGQLVAARKLESKRQRRDVKDLMRISKEAEEPPPPLSPEDTKKVARLKQMSEAKKAGKEVDPAEAKRLAAELQAPLLAGVFKVIGSKLEKAKKVLDRQEDEMEADSVADSEAMRRESVSIKPPPALKNRSTSGESERRMSDLVADSDTPGRKRLTFTPLPGALAEGEVLKKIAKLNEAQVFSGSEATEALVKKLHGPRILHIATHGFFLDPPEDTPKAARGKASDTRGQVEAEDAEQVRSGVQRSPMLRSGIALAGANNRWDEEDQDGILTAEEVAQLDLQGTELVVLSACETGTGDIANGEGVFGLRRALVLAGAQSQLVSLWKVSDQGTQELMGEYYRQLKAGEGRSRALQLAQKTLRSSAPTAHPYYWAAFIPLGNWRPIDGF